MTKIKSIKAKQILNSAGKPTVEVEISLENGQEATASAPRGLSRGQKEKRTINTAEAIKQINILVLPKLRDIDLSQEKLDAFLDKSGLAANAAIAVSVAFAKANKTLKLPTSSKMPQLMMLMFEGSKHGNSEITIQEFMLILSEFEKGAAVYQEIKDYLSKQGFSTAVGVEGGFSPEGFDNEKVLKTLSQFSQGHKIAIDVANNQAKLPPPIINNFIEKFNLYSIEDPVEEEKIAQWQKFYQKWGKTKLIIADDLTVTDSKKIEKYAKLKMFNAVIIKPDQQGTLTAALNAVKTARQSGLKIVVAHRGEETKEDFLADFALFVKADYVKFGSPFQEERRVKYERLKRNYQSGS